MKKNKKYSIVLKAFTLVELIIVITILGILSTVGFTYYSAYISDARDSKRLANLSGIRESMRLHITKSSLPLPSDNIEIRNNGETNLYQGYAGEDVLSTISYPTETKDPSDDQYYTYLLSKNRTNFQLLGFLENKPDFNSASINIGSTYAQIDYSIRFPHVLGSKIGILLEQESFTPVQEMPEYISQGYIDIVDSTSNQFNAYITDTYLLSGNQNDLIGIMPGSTCKKILETNNSIGTGIYTINPTGDNPVEVYCDMDVDGGGWTLVGRSVLGASAGDFGWLVSNGDIYTDGDIYSLGESSFDMNFSDVLLASYTSGKEVDYAVKVNIDKSQYKTPSLYEDATPTNKCEQVYPSPYSWTDACPFTLNWGRFERTGMPTTNRFHFRANIATGDAEYTKGLTRSGFLGNTGDGSDLGVFFGEQGMIFVR